MINTGEAYILRTCNADMTSYEGFVWPREGMVEAPDWRADAECGHGLHGFLWGEGDGSLASWDDDAVWLVAKIGEWIDLDGKVKFPRAEVVFVGDRASATARIVEFGASGAIVGGTATAGDRGIATAGYGGIATAGYGGTATAGYEGIATAGDGGTATAGYGGIATAGDGGTATAGYGGTATAGYEGTATAGYEGIATAGDGGTATAGDRGIATAGYGGTATAGDGGTATAGDRGIVQVRWYDGRAERYRICTGYVGEDGIKAGARYGVKGGKLVEAEQ